MVLVQQKESSRLQDALGPSFTSAVVGISVNGDVVEVFGTVSPGPWKVLISKGKHTCKGKKTQIQTILNFLLDIQLTNSADNHGNKAGQEQQEPLVVFVGQGSEASITNPTEDSSDYHDNAQIQDCVLLRPSPLINS